MISPKIIFLYKTDFKIQKRLGKFFEKISLSNKIISIGLVI